jgi:superfamily II DNA or RNA helicase
MTTSYDNFLKKKELSDSPNGFDVPNFPLSRTAHGESELELFPFQEAIVRWALKRGRAAIFADTGLGKTAMEAAWSYAVWQYTGNRVLILAPLCVAEQTVRESHKFGVPVKYVRESQDAIETGIYITNYEMLDNFKDLIEQNYFDGIVLDESSI